MYTEMMHTAARQKQTMLQSNYTPGKRKEESSTGPEHRVAAKVPNSSSETQISHIQQATQKVLRGTSIQGTH